MIKPLADLMLLSVAGQGLKPQAPKSELSWVLFLVKLQEKTKASVFCEKLLLWAETIARCQAA